MSLEPGEIIEGKYRIVRMIGEGGMGSVYEGENTRINRRVAIKVLHQAFARNEEALRRFEHEAQAAGRIGSDHILEVLDLGELANGDHFMVMEFLDGEPLSDRIRRLGRLTPHQATPLVRQLLKGLAAAHAAGIVHRDLKPDNVFVLREKAGVTDYVKIIDFGISKFQPLSGDGMKMTRTGAVMGTPYYMSPEQASGSREADARSDLYSVGVILYEAVTGRVPFDAPTFNQLMFKIVLSDIPPPQSVVPDLDPAYASIVLKSMARDVAHRFQSADDFAQALDGWLHSGRAVTIPPPDGGDHVPAADTRAKQLSAAGLGATPGTGTPGSWAAAPEPIVVPKKSAVPIVIALGALAALVVGGGIGVVMLATSGAATTGAAAMESAPAASEVTPASSATAAAPDASEAPAVPPTASSTGAPAASSASSVATQGGPVAVRPPGGKPTAVKPAETKAPPPADTKPPPKPTSTGVDFGY